jgi:hypothetical protein
MSLLLNGTSQYLSLTSALASGAPLTMACWFKSTSSTLNQALTTLNRQGSNDSLGLAVNGSVAGDPVQVYAGDPSFTTFGTAVGYVVNQWHHACGVFAAATDRRVFYDGGNKSTNAVSRNPASLGRTVIGAFWNNASAASIVSLFVGRMAHVGFWSVALSDAEVATLAAGALPSSIQSGSLVAYLPLTTDFTDSIGNTWTNNGTATIDSSDNPTMSGGGATVIPWYMYASQRVIGGPD